MNSFFLSNNIEQTSINPKNVGYHFQIYSESRSQLNMDSEPSSESKILKVSKDGSILYFLILL
jgi:hypothetical protein